MPASRKRTIIKKSQGGRKGVTAENRLTEPYRHPTAESLMRPEVGTQAQFRKKKPSVSYRYDSLPLFVHERLSTKAIIETLAGHKKDKQLALFSLFGDPQHSITDQILKAYEYKDKWVNRLVLGDSLVVMNSLVHYEGLGGQVQMIYMDPPYGVKFGSNFQPFVRKRDVKHNEDDDMTREPEMVKAYRDTWELGLHSYLTYMRDRLLIARELLTPSGSIFVQISDENLHHVREVMDEVFGAENFVAVIAFAKTAALVGELISRNYDFLIWYCKDKNQIKYNEMFEERVERTELGTFTWIETLDGTSRRLSRVEISGQVDFPKGRRFRASDISGQGESASGSFEFVFEGKGYKPSKGRHWSTNEEGMKKLLEANRIVMQGKTLAYKRYEDDFPYMPITHVWNDTIIGTFSEKFYVVQTGTLTVQRCLLMTTDPGDLVLDPTCGSGTTAYVAEQWGRRWITIDTSRVPLALARQRLLTATFPYYELKEPDYGPAGGFVYKRKQNNKGEEVGGIVSHVTLKSIANNEPPAEEVLVDRPEPINSITRVSGPFCLEATIPTPVDWEGDGLEDSGAIEAGQYGSFIDRMLEVLRRSPVLHLDGGKTVEFKSIRKPAKTLSLSAEAIVENPSPHPSPLRGEGEKGMLVAILFGPENGAISEKLVYEAAREAHAKNYTSLFVIGFAIQPGARNLVDNCEAAVGVPATYVQATPDLLMGDLLKNMRSSQIFSVCGLPEIALRKLSKGASGSPPVRYQVELLGLDVFDPITMEVAHRKGDDVPAWFLDTDYNGLCFHVSQAFFPRTSAWDNLKRALRSTHEDSVWDHLAGTVSAAFEAGEQGQIAVKVIDDRGNELLVVKPLNEAKR
ncbi:MAG: site-specific DNA-methyltransferase [Deltaproteobacteria bacterium]|nr:site-specific DNA-methyltransferase [Deltaproteobacteria bacterium]